MSADRRIGWIVLAAVAAGPVAALVLVLGPLGGPREPVITAGLLLGFALGWALLAIGSAVWTDPQPGWLPLQAEMMVLSSNSVQRIATSATHMAIDEVIAMMRRPAVTRRPRDANLLLPLSARYQPAGRQRQPSAAPGHVRAHPNQ